MKRLAWLAIAAAILFGVAYLASPLLGWRSIQAAARTGDAIAMARVIDFPSVRGNLKTQLRALFAARIHADPALKNNPFAGMGLTLLPGLVDKMADAYLTPQSIAVMVAQGRTPARENEALLLSKPVALQTHYAYVDLNRFRITAAGQEHPDLPLEFSLQRRGLFRWRLVRIDLPAEALK
jgi:Protein of unknown function (DUF2939)